jgi:hypothetical protein
MTTSPSVRLYPADIQNNFLTNCETGGNTRRCVCTLKWFEQHLSLTQFLADEDILRSGTIPSDYQRGISACS